MKGPALPWHSALAKGGRALSLKRGAGRLLGVRCSLDFILPALQLSKVPLLSAEGPFLFDSRQVSARCLGTNHFPRSVLLPLASPLSPKQARAVQSGDTHPLLPPLPQQGEDLGDNFLKVSCIGANKRRPLFSLATKGVRLLFPKSTGRT